MGAHWGGAPASLHELRGFYVYLLWCMHGASLSSRRSYLNQWVEVESECEKVKLPVEVERLVTFVKAGVGNWSHDLDTCSLATCTGEYSHRFRSPMVSSDSDTLNFDFGGSLPEQTPRSDPHIRQTDWCRRFLEGTGDISDRMLQVLDLMGKLHLNLPFCRVET